MIRFLIEKEFKQLFRNPFLPKLILVWPLMMMILMPWAANLEIRNIDLCIIDNDHSGLSARLIAKVDASRYFRLKKTARTYREGMESIEKETSDIILEIPRHFERSFINGQKTEVMISANTVNSTKGSIGSNYLASIVNEFTLEMQKEKITDIPTASFFILNLPVQNRFNPYLDYKYFMVPALMVMLLTMLCGFLPALNIVGEKEVGTIEQINVTPVNKFTFIMAKLIPYWIIGIGVLSICFLLARLLYGILPAGNLLTIYFFACIFILVVSGIGLIISNYSATLQQAMFVMFFFMIIFILMSGLFTPIHSMPEWAQVLTWFNPLKYFIEVMRGVYLKGSSIGVLYPQLAALSAFAFIFNGWAVISYKKSS